MRSCDARRNASKNTHMTSQTPSQPMMTNSSSLRSRHERTSGEESTRGIGIFQSMSPKARETARPRMEAAPWPERGGSLRVQSLDIQVQAHMSAWQGGTGVYARGCRVDGRLLFAGARRGEHYDAHIYTQTNHSTTTLPYTRNTVRHTNIPPMTRQHPRHSTRPSSASIRARSAGLSGLWSSLSSCANPPVCVCVRLSAGLAYFVCRFSCPTAPLAPDDDM